jgi:hypothetical protein
VILDARQIDAGVRITFSSAIGQSYRLERSMDLAPASWQTIATVTATDLSTEVDDPGSAGLPRKFYRVAENRSIIP